MNKMPFADWDSKKLPLGLIDPKEPNVIHRDFEIRPMNGEIRVKALTGMQAKSSTELLNDCLCAIVTRIGPYTGPLPKLVLRLTPIDRAYILFVSRYLYKKTHDIKDRRCPRCGRDLSAKLPLGLLPVTEPEIGTDLWLEDGSFTFPVTDVENGIQEARLRLPTCDEEQEAYQAGRSKEAFGAAYYLLSRAIVRLNGEGGPYKPEEVKKLDGHILDGLDDSLKQRASYGIDLGLEIACPNSACGHVVTEEAGVLDHFLGSSAQNLLRIIGAGL